MFGRFFLFFLPVASFFSWRNWTCVLWPTTCKRPHAISRYSPWACSTHVARELGGRRTQLPAVNDRSYPFLFSPIKSDFSMSCVLVSLNPIQPCHHVGTIAIVLLLLGSNYFCPCFIDSFYSLPVGTLTPWEVGLYLPHLCTLRNIQLLNVSHKIGAQ